MKGKRKVWVTLCLLLTILISGFGSKVMVLAQGVNQESAGEDTFRVVMEAGYAPFNWTQMTDENGGVKLSGASEYAGGYDVEMAKRIADKLGKKLEIIKTEWDGLVPALVSGKADAIIAGMSPTEERKETIDFTDIYYTSHLVMVVSSNGKYKDATSIQDFQGAKITAQLNTFHYSVIDQIKDVSKETAMDNFPSMRVALESGVIDGYVTEKPEALSASNANKNFKMIEFKEGFETSKEDTAIAVGVQKGSPLKDEINNILSEISEEERTEIMDEAIKNQPAVAEEGQKNWVVTIVKDNWPMFLRGAGVTLFISLIGTIIGLFIGLLVGMIRTVPVPNEGISKVILKIVNAILSVYIEIVRGTPMIVQAMVFFYGIAAVWHVNMDKMVAAIIIVSVNTGAYMSEIVRGGILSIDKGQFEAAQALGMKHFRTMVHVVMPQVVRNILPATGNEFVINIKDTSVLNVISVTELFFQTKTIAGNNFRYFEAFFVACVLYFVMTFTVTRILRFMEKKMDGPRNYNIAGNQMQVEKLSEKKSE